MKHRRRNSSFDLKRSLLETYALSERANEYLLQQIHPRAWRAQPPGPRGRTIADLFTHLHNARLKWLRASPVGRRIPRPLDRRRVTPGQARAALAQSAAGLAHLIADALERPGARVAPPAWTGFQPDAVSFLAYMISHEAHHRGQISLLARQLGHGLGMKGNRLWQWGRLARRL